MGKKQTITLIEKPYFIKCASDSSLSQPASADSASVSVVFGASGVSGSSVSDSVASWGVFGWKKLVMDCCFLCYCFSFSMIS